MTAAIIHSSWELSLQLQTRDGPTTIQEGPLASPQPPTAALDPIELPLGPQVDSLVRDLKQWSWLVLHKPTVNDNFNHLCKVQITIYTRENILQMDISVTIKNGI